ncbi:PTS sugar transporter subunit IIA [Pediococcus inopinatus]|uniref:PTS sugar transporter subunit IIA n=1 Tax=Pediococcus inopinatus TaxID=114090 RepID=UPI002B259205|nr:PTS sugar transporter subunit IIA [Pediococcus inopinatus]WPC18288.1 PTS sugar transporter subunit IIA [Pediococcus inopinatus]
MNEEVSTDIVFGESFVRHFKKALTFSQVVDKLSENLISKNLVENSYPQAVKEREKEFPTGLPTEPIGVAIPHTDPQYVKRNTVSIGILKVPIEMTIMGSSSDKVNISIIMLLSLAQANKQLNILQRIMTVVQDQDMLKKFETESDEEVAKHIQKAILEGL